MSRIEDAKIAKLEPRTIEERARSIMNNVSKQEKSLTVQFLQRIRRIVQGKLHVMDAYKVRATYDVSKTYNVVIDGNENSCTCPDQFYRGEHDPDHRCKHIRATIEKYGR